LPTIHVKPFDQMTLAELRAEHAQWVKATQAGAWGCFYQNAHDCRDVLARWIARREREAEGVAA
jgi:hypothetical protein